MTYDNGEPNDTGAQSGRRGEIPFLARFIATGFYSGYVPHASGTFGTFVGALFFLLPGFSHPLILASAIVVVFFLGVYTSGMIAAVEGNRLTKSALRAKEMFQPEGHASPDPSIVVIDEILGMWISMFGLYPSFTHPPVIAVVVAFVCFRFFDIVKPYPARQLERFGDGWGIMLDDVVAGIYANITTRILLAVLFSFLPALF